MAKKHEALNKAKQSGKKMIEGGKESGMGVGNVLGGTAKSIFYTLESAGEAGVYKVSKKKSENLNYSDEAREAYKEKAEKYSKRAKESIGKAGKSAKQVAGGLGQLGKGGAKLVGHTVKGGYHLIDAGDKAIGEKIEKKQIEKGQNPGKIGKFVRENVIKLMIALGALGYGSYEGGKYINDKNQEGKEIVINDEIVGDSNEVLLIPTGEYNLLNGKKITTNAPLTRRYLGGDLENSGDLIVGDTLTLNPSESLHNLWSKKITKYGQFTKDINNLDTIDVKNMSSEEIENFRFRYPIDATYLFVVKPYIDGNENRDTMPLEQFIKQTNKIVKDIKTDTESYVGGLTGDKKELFDAIRNDINGESIVAYAMTELCENKEDGEFNKEVFDILLKNSGVNYLSKIPAIYDGKTSYGLYQFTEFALYERDGKRRGASVVNKVLPSDKKIPGSVIDLNTWEEQTKAAYMNALYNLNLAVEKLTDQQAKELLEYQKNYRENFRDNITQLIAMCHHRTADAVALRDWHKEHHKNSIYKYGKAQTYGKASRNNYRALLKK